VRGVHVDGARHERRARAERERDRIDGIVPAGVDFDFEPSFEVGEYWPLVRP
jgi:hypothetical protein